MLLYVALCCPMLPYVALCCPAVPCCALLCPTLPYVNLSYPKVSLYCSKAERRVSGGVGGGGGGWCAKSFSCQTQLSLNCVKLFWSCFGVVVGVLTILQFSNPPYQHSTLNR